MALPINITEGRGTGFPTIYNAMKNNGSPDPIFETNTQSTHVLVTLPVHPLAYSNVGASDQASNQVANQVKVNVFSTLDDIIAFANGATNQANDGASDQVKNILNNEVNDRIEEILNILVKWTKRKELFDHLGLSNQTTNRKKYLDPLLNIGWVTMEFPEEKTSPKQRYRLTKSGSNILKLIN